MNEFSLLWPDGQPTRTWPVAPETFRDLELGAIVRAICTQPRYERALHDHFGQLCLDEATIRYRQTLLQDLDAQPEFTRLLTEALPLLEELALPGLRQKKQVDSLPAVLLRARELELLVATVQGLQTAFAAVVGVLQSEGLRRWQAAIAELAGDSQFQALCLELPELLSALRGRASITIGVNLDHQLRPEAAVLLAVNAERFTESSLLDRLFGKGKTGLRGIAPLHQPPLVNPTGGSGTPQRLSAQMVPLFQDLAKILEHIAEPVARELRKFAQLHGRWLAARHDELLFYLQALALWQRLQGAGLTLSFPAIVPAAERRLEAASAFNLQLALRELDRRDEVPVDQRIVKNDIQFGEDGRIAILTGPNQGGKTTYMQSIGLVQVLAQLGLPVPAAAASVSPADGIYTHYPVEEQLALGTGRFGDEAQRLRAIFEMATSESLVLLNESLATTGIQEGLRVARDIMGAFRQIGLRAVFTTHLYELAAAIDELNAHVAGTSRLFSLVASRPETGTEATSGNSYRVTPGPPLGRSFAEQIALRYGISHEQLQALLRERALLEEEE
ncbi:MAG: hypothetical protein H6651_21490 [Ardenticatenales bacterium]|nr:hypothetical protein [Ardenticatenales bacterium]